MERSGGDPVRRGDAVLCDLNPVVGTEQAGVRPALIVQSDRANTVSPHTIIVPFTTRIRQAAFTCTDPCGCWGVNSRFGGVMRADPRDRQTSYHPRAGPCR